MKYVKVAEYAFGVAFTEVYFSYFCNLTWLPEFEKHANLQTMESELEKQCVRHTGMDIISE